MTGSKLKKYVDMFFVGVATFLFGIFLGSNPAFTKLTILKTVDKAKDVVSGKVSLQNMDFKLFWQVYKDVKTKYVDAKKVEDDQQFYYGSIKGLVQAVKDPATVFLDPQETKDYNESLSPKYEGIGAQLDDTPKGVAIVAVFDGAPAQKAGLMPGDIILEVDGKKVNGKTARELAKIIRGPAGTQVTLTVWRERPVPKKLTITITRGKITVPAIRIDQVKDNIAVLRISRFTEDTYEQFRSELKTVMHELWQDVKSQKIKGLIIDLRGNPGGYLYAAIDLASYFLEPGKPVVYVQTRQGIVEERKTYTIEATNPYIPGGLPVVVLVDGATASASEIFAGALQYYKRAVLIGQPTFGKGTVQQILEYNDGSSLHLTIAYWLLPNKEHILPDSPVHPDIEVEFDFEAKLNKGLDNQLEEAYKYLKNKIKK